MTIKYIKCHQIDGTFNVVCCRQSFVNKWRCIFGSVLLQIFSGFVMLSPLTCGTSVQMFQTPRSGRSGPMLPEGIGLKVKYKGTSGKPLAHIGRSPTAPNEQFVLLFNQMLASGHHSDYDART
ncbi:hypothetical protein JKA62_24100 [Pseudomonas sp. B7]|nr:hypothetical protein [Pseudomonas sp. B7]